MKRPHDHEKTLAVLHELPPEVSLEQANTIIAALPLTVGLTTGLLTFFKYHLNTLLMTSTAGTILVGSSIYFFGAAEPAPENKALEPAPVTIEAADVPVNLDAPAVVLDLPAEKPAPAEPKPSVQEAVISQATEPQFVPERTAEPEPELLATIDPAPMQPADPQPARVVLTKEGERAFDLTGFHSVILFSSVDVVVEQGPFSVRAVGEEEGLDRLKISTHDGALRIESGSGRGSATHCRTGTVVMVRMPEVQKLELIGSGTITASDFASTEHLILVVKGSGDLIVHGLKRADALSIQLDGSGDVVCGEVDVAGSTVIALAGSGDVRVAGSTERIDIGLIGSGDVAAGEMRAAQAKVRVVGSGDVQLASSGSIDQTITGSGEVHVIGSAGGDRPRGVGPRTY